MDFLSKHPELDSLRGPKYMDFLLKHPDLGSLRGSRYMDFLSKQPDTGLYIIRTSHSLKRPYKIEFWSYENVMPRNEEISIDLIKES